MTTETTAAHSTASGKARTDGTLRVEPMLRLIAGAFVVLSILLGMYVQAAFLWFGVFVGANLFQSALTGWCPMMAILRKLGARG